MRAKFFQLYNAAIPVTLFDRLRFIVCNQEWEHLADTFWLKQGLVGSWRSASLQALSATCSPSSTLRSCAYKLYTRLAVLPVAVPQITLAMGDPEAAFWSRILC